MEELTNVVMNLSCSTPIPRTPKAQPAAEVIEEARQLEDAGDAQAALAMALDAEETGNIVPFRKLVRYHQSILQNGPSSLYLCCGIDQERPNASMLSKVTLLVTHRTHAAGEWTLRCASKQQPA